MKKLDHLLPFLCIAFGLFCVANYDWLDDNTITVIVVVAGAMALAYGTVIVTFKYVVAAINGER